MHWTYTCTTCATTRTGAALVACINRDHDVQPSHPLIPST